MTFFNFFKPKWQHSNPTIRLKALENLGDSDCQILAQIAATDPEIHVRQAALSKIDDWRVLAPLANQDIDKDIAREITNRVDTLQREAVYSAQGIDAKLTALNAITKDELLAEIVLGEAEGEIRLAAIKPIESQSLLADLVTKNCGKSPALLAIDKIDDENLLRMTSKKASNRVVRARAQAKLDQLQSDRDKPDPETERELEISSLLEKVRLLTEADDAEAAMNEFRRLQRRWHEIGKDDPRGSQFDEFCAVIRRRQQEQAALEERRRLDEAERRKHLDRLQQILAEMEALAIAVTTVEESRFLQLHKEWADLIPSIAPPLPDNFLMRYDEAYENFTKGQTLAAQEKTQELELLRLLDTVASIIEQMDLDQAQKELAEAQRAFDSWRPAHISRKQVAERLVLLREQQQESAARRDEIEHLRLESNWKQRQDLLAEATALLAADDVKSIEKRFSEIKTLWQQPLDLPAGVVDLDQEFRTVVSTIEERLDSAEKEESWLRWQNKILKTQLIADAEGLHQDTDLHRVFKRIKELQGQWRAVGTAPAKDEPLLWRKFHEATERNFARCKTFFQELDIEAEQNLQQKTALLNEALACQDSAEWQKTTELIKDLQARWKAIGRGPQNKEQEVYTAFRAACDHFFARRKVHHAELDQERLVNLDRKQTLCQEAESLADQPDAEHKVKFQELQASWKTIGPVPREQDHAIWQRFRTACDRYYSWLDTLRPENLTSKEALCVEAEELIAQVGPDTNFNLITKKIVDLQRRWKKIGPAPKEAQDAIWLRFKECCDTFFEAKFRHDQAIDQQRPLNQAEKETLLARARELCTGSTVTKETVQEIISIQEAWQRVGPAEKDQEQLLQKDFNVVCNAFFKERREAFLAIDQLHRENLKKKEGLCLRLELVAGITPPSPVEQTEGKQAGMTLAEQLKVAFETNFVLSVDDQQDRKRRVKNEIDAVTHEWQKIGPVPREHEHAIRKRYNEALASAVKV